MKCSECIVAAHPRAVLLGSNEHKVLVCGLADQVAGVAGTEAVMIRERAFYYDFGARQFQRAEKLLRITDPGKGEHTLAFKLRRGARLGNEICAKHVKPGIFSLRRRRVTRAAIADHENRLRARELRRKRRTQRPRRKDTAVSQPSGAIDDKHGKIFCERWVLKAVIHDDDIGATCFGELRATRAIARDNSWRNRREQQRLVADFARRMFCRIGKQRPALTAAIAARQEERLSADRLQNIAGSNRGRRFPGAPSVGLPMQITGILAR